MNEHEQIIKDLLEAIENNVENWDMLPFDEVLIKARQYMADKGFHNV